MSNAAVYLLLEELGDGHPLLDFSNNSGEGSFGGYFLGEEYRLFGRIWAI